MSPSKWRWLVLGMSLQFAVLPARSGGNLALQMEARMVLQTGCAIWTGEAANTATAQGMRIVCSPDASSLAVNVNAAQNVPASEESGSAARPFTFAPASFHPNAPWAARSLGSTEFGMKLTALGGFIPLPASGWGMRSMTGSAWSPDVGLLSITFSW
jgi:hypothetical protein